ncbi:MAG: hypothetical protein CMM52_14405 [Rhodospirillaceae bacterium]|nr:hypothetical protein [Rhodospirillaceae bacterium]|tara:strand:+ start:1433 stop:1903 length:471 start_codon:yes stop_codon:yes gene_type:complete
MADKKPPKKINRHAEWGFILAPLIGPTAVVIFHIVFKSFDDHYLRSTFHILGWPFFIIPSYVLTVVFGLPVHIILKRKRFNLTTTKWMAFYIAYGGLVGSLFLWPFIDHPIDSAGMIFGINTSIMGAISGFSMWLIGVRCNPDFGYVNDSDQGQTQ